MSEKPVQSCPPEVVTSTIILADTMLFSKTGSYFYLHVQNSFEVCKEFFAVCNLGRI